MPDINNLPGYIYVLTNESMPGLLKIGHTTKSVSVRVQELSNATGLPTPFHVEVFFRSTACRRDERRAHIALRKYRINANREFFKVSTKLAIDTIAQICGSEPKSKKALPNERREFRDTIRKEAEKLFWRHEEVVCCRVLKDLPDPLYNPYSDVVTYGWSPLERVRTKQEPKQLSLFSGRLEKYLDGPEMGYLDEFSRNVMLAYCKRNKCKFPLRAGYSRELYSPNGVVRITLTERRDFSRPRLEEIVKRVISEEKALIRKVKSEYQLK